MNLNNKWQKTIFKHTSLHFIDSFANLIIKPCQKIDYLKTMDYQIKDNFFEYKYQNCNKDFTKNLNKLKRSNLFSEVWKDLELAYQPLPYIIKFFAQNMNPTNQATQISLVT